MRLSPLQVPVSSLRLSPVIQGAHEPLFGFSNLLEWITELKEALTYVYWFIMMDITKDMNG